MPSLVHQIGELFLRAVPVALIVLVFYFVLRSLFFKPILAVMAEREARTLGAQKSAEAAQAAAAEKVRQYEEALRQAKAKVYAEQEAERKKLLDERAAVLKDARSKASAEVGQGQRTRGRRVGSGEEGHRSDRLPVGGGNCPASAASAARRQAVPRERPDEAHPDNLAWIVVSGDSVLAFAAMARAAEEGGSPAESPLENVFKWIHFVIIAIAAYWLFKKVLPPHFRRNADKISAAITKATAAKAEAERQLKEAAAKLTSLEQEVAQFRAQAQKDAAAELERLRGMTKIDVEKVERRRESGN